MNEKSISSTLYFSLLFVSSTKIETGKVTMLFIYNGFVPHLRVYLENLIDVRFGTLPMETRRKLTLFLLVPTSMDLDVQYQRVLD